MKKHKAAIQKIRQTLKELNEEKPQLRAQIQALKFDASGVRRPETGTERHLLKDAYVHSTRRAIRANLLAYGFLRGVPYRAMEPKSDPELIGYALYRVFAVIQAAVADDPELKAEWTFDRVRALAADKKAEAA